MTRWKLRVGSICQRAHTYAHTPHPHHTSAHSHTYTHTHAHTHSHKATHNKKPSSIVTCKNKSLAFVGVVHDNWCHWRSSVILLRLSAIVPLRFWWCANIMSIYYPCQVLVKQRRRNVSPIQSFLVQLFQCKASFIHFTMLLIKLTRLIKSFNQPFCFFFRFCSCSF